MILLITYDKNSVLKNYESLYNAIKSSGTWWHHLENTWIIRTEYDVKYWYTKLAQHLSQGDRVLIIEVAPTFHGWLKKEAWDWLRKQFRKEGYDI